ncbi:MAG: ZIP family metal transporter [Patescibacteria group bacterium]
MVQEIYLYAFASVFAVSAISFSGLLVLSLKERILRKYVFVLVSLAVGALLGDAFIHLIPESFEELDQNFAGILVITGILIFFSIEKFLHWHHHEDDEAKSHHTGKMILVSDGLHNFIDGAIITASYFVSIEVGIATTLAIILHEIPQEVGDFGILLHSGYTAKKALFFNFVSALLAVFGAIVALIIHEAVKEFIIWIIPIAAGGFIYIAGSDLVPELHKTKNLKASIAQFLAIILGVTTMILLLFAE